VPRFKKLLVAITEDAGDAAVQYTARLAVRARTDLTLVDVMEDVPRFVRPLLPRGWNVPKVIRAQKRASLERSAARARRLGVEPAVVLLTGPRSKAIVREVVHGGHDLLAADAATSDGPDSVDTTAARLVRECPCPVLLVRPSRRRRRARVLVAVDAGPWRMKGTDEINPGLFDAALWFAEHLMGELHVLHVWAPYAERFMRRAGLTPAAMRQFVADAREQASKDLEDTVAPFREHIAPAHVHLEEGDPRKEIVRLAAAHRFDLLVIGTVARSGLAGRLIGNTAESVLARVPCSILVVRPDPRNLEA
jgi:universal stress protein E